MVTQHTQSLGVMSDASSKHFIHIQAQVIQPSRLKLGIFPPQIQIDVIFVDVACNRILTSDAIANSP